jgi:peptidoglycan hydrolase-like protein with peptidoglycan-binding domain
MVMRALILAFSIVGIVASVTCAKAGLSSTPREPQAAADTATQAAQETEDQIGLTKTKRREVQRDLTRLGYETKANGKFDDSTRAAIASWQDEHGYPKTGFLDITQHKALLEEGAAAMNTSESDNLDHRRGRGRVHRTRVVGGPFGVIGHAIGGLFRR